MFRPGDVARVVEDPVLSRAKTVPFGDDITVRKGRVRAGDHHFHFWSAQESRL